MKRALAAAFALAVLAAAASPVASAPPLLTDGMRADLAALVASAKATDGAYETVRELLEAAGPRLAGSPGDARAVAWADGRSRRAASSNVHTEPVTAPHWERGEESGELLLPIPLRLSLCALGGSVGTAPEGVEADVVEATSLEGVDALGEKAKGKIVLDLAGHGALRRRAAGTARRSRSARTAPRRGREGRRRRPSSSARSARRRARFPHTGAMRLRRGRREDPGRRPRDPDADLLHRVPRGGHARARADAARRADAPGRRRRRTSSARSPGREKPEEIVLVGGHLDSWDLGMGAIDDGAGCGIAIEAARLVGALREAPRRTIRVVLFANEENGLAGGRAYAKAHAAELAPARRGRRDGRRRGTRVGASAGRRARRRRRSWPSSARSSRRSASAR